MVSLARADRVFRLCASDVRTVMLSSKTDVASVDADETRDSSTPGEDGELSSGSEPVGFSTVSRTVSVFKGEAFRPLPDDSREIEGALLFGLP